VGGDARDASGVISAVGPGDTVADSRGPAVGPAELVAGPVVAMPGDDAAVGTGDELLTFTHPAAIRAVVSAITTALATLVLPSAASTGEMLRNQRAATSVD